MIRIVGIAACVVASLKLPRMVRCTLNGQILALKIGTVSVAMYLARLEPFHALLTCWGAITWNLFGAIVAVLRGLMPYQFVCMLRTDCPAVTPVPVVQHSEEHAASLVSLPVLQVIFLDVHLVRACAPGTHAI